MTKSRSNGTPSGGPGALPPQPPPSAAKTVEPPPGRPAGNGGDRDRNGGRYGGPPPPRGGPPGGSSYGRDSRRGGGGRPSQRGGGGGVGGGGAADRITFRSWEEERDFVEERRRKRRERKSLWDVEPTPDQLEAERAMDSARVAAGGAVGVGGLGSSRPPVASQPQQTRHARRIYVGHLPEGITDDQLGRFFLDSIAKAQGRRDATGIPDPILNVYINQERRFAFIEFKTMEMASAVLAFDGINILGMGKVKIKRPNDYNPTIVPELNPNALPSFDTSQLGIVSTTVPDGPDKIFIGGLHYHLTDDQVLELLEAFGPVKAFNLVKGELGSSMNKGFGFVQYADPATTPIAIMGLNGMDIGGGKAISARGAGQRSSAPAAPAGMPAAISAYQPQPPGAPPVPVPGAAGNIVNGVDVDALLNAAMGGGGGAAAGSPPPFAAPPPPQQQQYQQHMAPLPAASLDVHQIAAAALEAAGAGAAPPIPPPAAAGARTKILVLLNMVMDEDLATDEDHAALLEEVREECAKFGRLVSVKVPRMKEGVNPSAVKKVFLEYVSVEDAARAEGELMGRQFGPNVVQCAYLPEDAYKAGMLY